MKISKLVIGAEPVCESETLKKKKKNLDILIFYTPAVNSHAHHESINISNKNVLGVICSFLKFPHVGWRIMKTCYSCCFISDKPLKIALFKLIEIWQESTPKSPWYSAGSGPRQPLIGLFLPTCLSPFKYNSTLLDDTWSQRFEQTLNPKCQFWDLSSWGLILLFLSFSEDCSQDYQVKTSEVCGCRSSAQLSLLQYYFWRALQPQILKV